METIFSGEKNNLKNYVAFFDLDQTIANSVSGKSLVIAAYKKGLMTCKNLINAIYVSIAYKLKLKDPVKIIDDMIIWVKGIPEKTMVDLCSEVFREVILPSVYKEAIAEIEFHKAKNAKIVILSSALTTICQKMAACLNIDDFICSDLEVKNGYMTGRPLGHICFGETKALRLKEYCELINSPSSEAWYYADSISDLPALNAVGNPVCVNPDGKLKKTAEKRGWKIFTWKN